MDDLESKVDWEEHRQDKHHHSTLRLAEFAKQPIEWSVREVLIVHNFVHSVRFQLMHSYMLFPDT